MSEHEVHKKYYSCEDDRSHHHNNRRTLKLVPRRPADLLGKFLVRLFYVNRYFAHFLIFVGSWLEACHEPVRVRNNPISCRDRAIRTPINGFGDRYSTLELCPFFRAYDRHLLRRCSSLLESAGPKP